MIVGTNVEMEMEGDSTLVIRVDLSERHGRSASGKTVRVASTEGNVKVPTEANQPSIKVGLNVFSSE